MTTTTAVELLDEVRTLQRALRTLLRTAPEGRTGSAAEVVLGVLAETGEVRPGSLACRLGISPSVLSRQLAELEEVQLVERRPDPDDGRAHLVHVSPAGADVVAEAAGRRAERLRELLADWSDDEARAALATVAKLRGSLTPASGASTAAAPHGSAAAASPADPPEGEVRPLTHDHRHQPAAAGRRRPVSTPQHETSSASGGPAAVRARQEVDA
ncbi:MarR family transcriptional regulator [Pseudokineococcus basanitobsidens]|uniref:MarR family transcriptional regulator n=1 Tax=Pseudokineococcus basanitobsidens TaxID=1926649 RepID=A0ABU8RNH8_9ACTN